MLGGMVSLCSLAICLRTISEYRKRSPQIRQCHWSRAKMYGRHSELFGSSLGSGILIFSRGRAPRRNHNPKSTISVGCAADERDELASFHSITSSGRLSSGSGMVRPSVLAILRLMTSSTFAQSLPERSKSSRTRKPQTSVVSDVLLPHELRLVQRGHRQRGRRQVHLLRRW